MLRCAWRASSWPPRPRIGVGYLVAWLLRVPRHGTGAPVQGGFRGNLAYVGLPAITLALTGADGAIDPAVRTLAVLALALIVPIYNIVAVVVLVAAAALRQASRQRLARLPPSWVSPWLRTPSSWLAWQDCCSVERMGIAGYRGTYLRNVGADDDALALLGVGATLSLTA